MSRRGFSVGRAVSRSVKGVEHGGSKHLFHTAHKLTHAAKAKGKHK